MVDGGFWSQWMVESTRWWIFHHIVDKLTDVMIMMSLFMEHG